MGKAKMSKGKLARELDDLRAEHEVLLKKMEKARLKFEKRSQKLQAAEAEIAALERRYYEPKAQKLGQAASPKDHLRPATLIFNPSSESNKPAAQQLADIVGQLRAHGILAHVHLKTSGNEVRELAREAVGQSVDLVIAAGGDDTVEEVACELVGSATSLGIIPIGTMNNLARSLGIPTELEEACALLGMGLTRMIDVGHVTSGEKSASSHFLEAAAVGLSALAKQAHDEQSGFGASLPKTMRDFDLPPGRLQVEFADGRVLEVDSHIVTVSNSPLTGANMLLAPNAKMDDGMLDVAIYEGMSRDQVLNYIRTISNGSQAKNHDIIFHHTPRVRVISDASLDGQEGQGADRHVLQVEVLPGALSMIVGEGIALSLPVQVGVKAPPISQS